MRNVIAARNGLLRRIVLAWRLAALLALALPGACAAAPAFAPLNGYIADEAQVLSPRSRTEIASELSSLEAQSSDQLFVYIAKSLQGYAIEDFGYQLGRAWGAGQKGLNNGVVLIVAPSEGKVRIEVGRGLEPYLTDALSTLIIENAILPAIREGKLAEGIMRGVQDISKVLLSDEDAAEERARQALKNKVDWSLPPALIALFFLVALTVIFVVMFYRNLQDLRAWRAKGGARKIRFGKAPLTPQSEAGGQIASWMDIPIALGMTLLQFISLGSSSNRSSSGSSSSGGGGGGGGDFGGGGASGKA